jgi:hypothetical protein
MGDRLSQGNDLILGTLYSTRSSRQKSCGRQINVYVAHQDRRVVVTQQPKASGLSIGERLIQGDRSIIKRRRKRAAL